jgi:D-sedoheptulose 7-phosphate isomerase
MTDPILAEVVARRFQQSIDVPTRFFESNADLVSRACLAMARRFHRGGRLLVFGSGGCATDAQHVSVEFVHPVIVGKRALPAMALTNDIAAFTGIIHQHGLNRSFAQQLRVLAQSQDIALGLSSDGNDESVLVGLRQAVEIGLLTLGLAGAGGGEMVEAGLDFCFVVPSDDPIVVQETHETLYHILWELVHVFFEHRGLLEGVGTS